MVLKCMWTTPSGNSLFNDHPFGTFDAGIGRRPPHQSRQFGDVQAISALPFIADVRCEDRQVRKGANALNRCAIARCAGSPTVSAVTGGKIVKT